MLPNSTLRLEANAETPSYMIPWAPGGVSNSSATVTVVIFKDKRYFVTNAHAVLNQKYLKVKLDRNSTELPMDVVWVDPILDLALLKPTSIEAEEFLNKEMQPLELDPDFQKQGTEVYAYGYPTGGRNRTFTKGNISRVEVTTVSLSKNNAIMVQTSAAINPGNSGGPITRIIDDMEKCIGIVAQGHTSLQNTGYFIPACTVIETIIRYERYRKLKEKGFIDFVTVPCCNFSWQQLKNPVLRAELGLPKTLMGGELTGILVTSVSPDSCAYGVLQPDDIIQEIENIAVQSNGQVQIPELEHPLSLNFIILRKQYLDTLTMTVQRKNTVSNELETKTIQVRLTQQLSEYISSPRYLAPLKYHVQPSGEKGAYVFIRYTSAYKSGFTSTKGSTAPSFFADLSGLSKQDTSEIVVLQNIILSEETDGYESFPANVGTNCGAHRVITANGKSIKCLYDLTVALSDTSKVSKIEFENGRVLYIAPAHAEAIKNLTASEKITFFTSPKIAKIDPTPVISEIKSLGAQEHNQFSFLKHVETRCVPYVPELRACVKHRYSDDDQEDSIVVSKGYSMSRN